jgi:hypothetical protein
MATRYSPNIYASDRYLNTVASLEAFDRSYHPRRQDLRVRVRRCVSLAGEPILSLIGDAEWWIATLVDDRNDIAHHLGRRPRQERPQRYFFAESAYWLYICCLLRTADAPEAVFGKIAQNNGYGFLQRRLAEIMVSQPT